MSDRLCASVTACVAPTRPLLLTSKAPNISLIDSHPLQVKKLSWEDGGLYHRQLYMRNVGSTKSLPVHDGTLDSALPPPSRVAGDIISFKRCAVCAGQAVNRPLSL